MRPADGAGFYQGTDFWNWDVEQMWAAVDRHEPTDQHWNLQSSWRATHELILTHKYRVEEYREKLIQAWPPDRNAAAAAYVARLDRLIASLGETYEAAVANDGAFSGAIWAIADRRRELKKVYDQYKANQAKLADYARAEAEFGGTGAWNAMQPEVAKAQQEHVRLQSQASTIMVGLSTELREATASFKAPKRYHPTGDINDDRDPGGDAETPTPLFAGGTDLSSTREGYATSTPRPTPLDPAQQSTFSRPQPGLVLDGADPPRLAPLSPPTNPAPPVHPSPGPGLTPILPSPIGPGNLGTPPGGPRSVPAGWQSLPASGSGRVIPGVIGGAPGMPGQPGAGSRPVQRVSPVGGLIGGQATHGGSSGMAGGGLGPMGMRGTHERRSDSESRRWDPDNPWETAEGVSPVLEALPERRIDPGPAIGLDR